MINYFLQFVVLTGFDSRTGFNAHVKIFVPPWARYEEPLVCPRERYKVRILSRENCLKIMKNITYFLKHYILV